MEVGDRLPDWLRRSLEADAAEQRRRLEGDRRHLERAERELAALEALLRGYWVL